MAGRHTMPAGQWHLLGRHLAAASVGALAAGGTSITWALAAGTGHAEQPPTITLTGSTSPDFTCDLAAPPEFGNPATPDEITNRACGYVDDAGRLRSFDPWIDGQLLAGLREV